MVTAKIRSASIRDTRSDRLFTIANYTFLGIILLAVAYPLLYIVSSSFSSPEAVLSGRVFLWPVEPSLEGYREVFEYRKIWIGYRNSIYYAVVGTFINVVATVLAAYPLSRSKLMGRNVIMFLFAFTMMFNGGLIPTYLVVRSVGLLNTRWALMLPMAISVWNMIITRTYFKVTIPDELLEASQIDGCSDFRFVWSVVLPLSGPILAVISLFYAVNHWNQYFWALVYLRDLELFPLQLFLREILVQNEVSNEMIGNIESATARDQLRELIKYALIIVASLPVLAAYPFVQRYFVKGVMIGALKG